MFLKTMEIKKNMRKRGGLVSSEAGRIVRPPLQSGFTLIEILVVIGMIAVLAAIVLIAINPARQFAQGRDAQRTSNLNAILNSVGQRMADNKGLFRTSTDAVCVVDIPQNSTTTIKSIGGADLRPCLVPTYISEIPLDPIIGTFVSGTNYDTGYQITKDGIGRIHVYATTSELSIPRQVPIEIVR